MPMGNFIYSKFNNFSNSAIKLMTNCLPEMTIGNKRVLKGIKWVGEHISSPQNRLILGASALLSQPFIDLYNKKVDEDTRRSSAARTVAKILAGTTSGFLVRYYSIKAIEKMTQIPSKSKKFYQTVFTPNPKLVKITARKLSQYKKTIGSLLALWVMLITNFLFDAPVTKKLTNKFIPIFARKNDNKKSYPKNYQLNNLERFLKIPSQNKNQSSNLIVQKVNSINIGGQNA